MRLSVFLSGKGSCNGGSVNRHNRDSNRRMSYGPVDLVGGGFLGSAVTLSVCKDQSVPCLH